MKSSIICLRIAGVVSVMFTVFHFFFRQMFKWDTALSCLSQSDRAIMLTYHYASILVVGFMSFVFLFQAEQIMESKLGTSVLILSSVFYLLRIVTEFTLFGFSGVGSTIIIGMCLIPLSMYAVALFSKRG